MDDINIIDLLNNYKSIRKKTLQLCEALETEDYVIQSSEDVSPPKWHLAHTTWFFEIFILRPHLPGYKSFSSEFIKRFNSYYQTLNQPYSREKRGQLSSPTLTTIQTYPRYVDENMHKWITENSTPTTLKTLYLGLNHEQQHQELLLMDIKYNFFNDPDPPTYRKKLLENESSKVAPLNFLETAGGLINIGHKGNSFCFDNELPLHKKFLLPFALASRLITNGDYLEFIDAGGYKKPELWLFEGWYAVEKYKWFAPLYWQCPSPGNWSQFSLYGTQSLNLNEPVSHVSFFEADAYARWKKARLPTEFEWEHFVSTTQEPIIGNFLEKDHLHPKPDSNSSQFYGDVWEWTSSPYSPYPEYSPLGGALGEYNGKFMCNQFVLRGGSCTTPQSHIRSAYRNYYSPDKRWQFSGIRLAQL